MRDVDRTSYPHLLELFSDALREAERRGVSCRSTRFDTYRRDLADVVAEGFPRRVPWVGALAA